MLEPNTEAGICSICDASIPVGAGHEILFALICTDCHSRGLEPGIMDSVYAIEMALKKKGETLKWYQSADARWMSQCDNALLAIPPGGGKSCTSLVSIKGNPPIVVICPKVAKGVWKREALRWRGWRPGSEYFEVSGKDGFNRWPKPGELYAVNFEILPSPKDMRPYPGTIVIVDEVHRIKNPDNKCTQRARALIAQAVYGGGKAYGLSGTPMLNRPDELFEVLESLGLGKSTFGSLKYFRTLFQARRGRYGVWQYGNPLPEFYDRVKKVMLVRKREDVMKGLPPLTIEDIPVTVDDKTLKVCDEAMAELAKAGLTLEDFVDAASRADEAVAVSTSGARKLVFEKIAAARAALAEAKLPYLIELVRDLEEDEEPTLVFSAHLAAADIIGQREGWGSITGGSGDRTNVENKFQAGELKGVVGTIQAAGVAITLTRATHVVFLDLCWTPALNEQSMYRCHRIGTDHPVFVKRLMSNHALDIRVATLLDRKARLIDKTINGAALGDGEAHPDLAD